MKKFYNISFFIRMMKKEEKINKMKLMNLVNLMKI